MRQEIKRGEGHKRERRGPTKCVCLNKLWWNNCRECELNDLMRQSVCDYFQSEKYIISTDCMAFESWMHCSNSSSSGGYMCPLCSSSCEQFSHVLLSLMIGWMHFQLPFTCIFPSHFARMGWICDSSWKKLKKIITIIQPKMFIFHWFVVFLFSFSPVRVDRNGYLYI